MNERADSEREIDGKTSKMKSGKVVAGGHRVNTLHVERGFFVMKSEGESKEEKEKERRVRYEEKTL